MSKDNLVDDITSQFDTRRFGLISPIKQYITKLKKIECGSIPSLSVEARARNAEHSKTKSELKRQSKFEFRKRKREIRDGTLPVDTPLVKKPIDPGMLPAKIPRTRFEMPNPEELEKYWLEPPLRPDTYQTDNICEKVTNVWLTKECCEKISRFVRDMLNEMHSSIYNNKKLNAHSFAVLIDIIIEKVKLIKTVLRHVYLKTKQESLDALDDSDSDGVLEYVSTDPVEEDIKKQFEYILTKHTDMKGELETTMIRNREKGVYLIQFADMSPYLKAAYDESWYLRNLDITLSKYQV